MDENNCIIHQLKVTEDNVRLDRYLALKLPQYSRTYFQKLLTLGLIKVNGIKRAGKYRLRYDDIIDLTVPGKVFPAKLIAEPIPLSIIYEDESLLIVNKPAGLVVHPAAGHPSGTLVNALLNYYQQKEIAIPQNHEIERPDFHWLGLIHRIDKDTTGILVIAKTEPVRVSLTRQFARRTVQKVYLAIVLGKIVNAQGIISAPVGRDLSDRKKMAVNSISGRLAETEFYVVQKNENFTLVELHPRTGRTHQLRVHLQQINHPIAGDKIYSLVEFNSVRKEIFSRPMLHAWRIGFTHPQTNKFIEFQAPIPSDFIAGLKNIGFNPDNLVG